MPPYLADRAVGHFLDDDRLSPEQIKTMVHWVEDAQARRAARAPTR